MTCGSHLPLMQLVRPLPASHCDIHTLPTCDTWLQETEINTKKWRGYNDEYWLGPMTEVLKWFVDVCCTSRSSGRKAIGTNERGKGQRNELEHESEGCTIAVHGDSSTLRPTTSGQYLRLQREPLQLQRVSARAPAVPRSHGLLLRPCPQRNDCQAGGHLGSLSSHVLTSFLSLFAHENSYFLQPVLPKAILSCPPVNTPDSSVQNKAKYQSILTMPSEPHLLSLRSSPSVNPLSMLPLEMY